MAETILVRIPPTSPRDLEGRAGITFRRNEGPIAHAGGRWHEVPISMRAELEAVALYATNPAGPKLFEFAEPPPPPPPPPHEDEIRRYLDGLPLDALLEMLAQIEGGNVPEKHLAEAKQMEPYLRAEIDDRKAKLVALGAETEADAEARAELAELEAERAKLEAEKARAEAEKVELEKMLAEEAAAAEAAKLEAEKAAADAAAKAAEKPADAPAETAKPTTEETPKAQPKGRK